jgi:toxin ParE1/3/4
MQIALSRLAEQDIQDILQYTLEQWGEEQLETYAAALNQALHTLEHNPHLGRSREDLYRGCRSLRVEQHIIFYTVREDTLSVARVLHSKMDARRHVRTE